MMVLSLLALSNFLFSFFYLFLTPLPASLSLSLYHLVSTCLWSKAHSSESHVFIPAKHTLHSSYTLTLTSHTLPGLQATYSICICLLGPLLMQFNSLMTQFCLFTSVYYIFISYSIYLYALYSYSSILFSCIPYHIYVCILYVHLLYDSIHCHLKVQLKI